MAATPFKFPPLFRKPKNVEIPKRSGARAVAVDSNTAGYSKSRFEFYFWKNASNKKYSKFSRFLLLWQDYSYMFMFAGAK